MDRTSKVAVVKSLEADPGELEKINQFTLKELTAEEVFVFKVRACSNEVDRDGESFTVEALQELCDLYRGKPVISDHIPAAQNQVARVYDAEVVADDTRTTKLGEPYTALVLHIFIPRLSKNADLIAEIEAGIKKEVSVGCSCQQRICSVCGQEVTGWTHLDCGHTKGTVYDGKLCAVRLAKITDAYEVSFVAVPAQKDAGTTKAAEKVSTETSGAEPPKTNPQPIFVGFLKFLQQ